MSTRSHKQYSQQGMTLIELLIALVLGVFILLAATQMFAYTKASTRSQEAAARLMENGRAATEILNRHIRMARYYGCAGVEAASVTNHYDSTKTSVVAPAVAAMNGYDQQGIFGVDGASGAPDEITVFQAIDDQAEVLAEDVDLNGTTIPIKITAPQQFVVGDTVAVTDCAQADIATITAVTGSGVESLALGNCTTCTQAYNAGAVIVNVNRSRFYLDTGISGENALFVEDPWDASDTPLELIEGVEDMQIAYGRDTDDDGISDQYVTPANIYAACNASGDENPSCWRKITSVRISLLMRSTEDNVAMTPQTYTFNGGSATTATDRRFYREFFTVIALRNYRP